MSAEAPAKKSSFKIDAGLTFVAQALVAICTFFQYRFIKTGWLDVASFASYSQLFRVRNVVEWMVLLVMPTALARQMAALRATDEHREAGVYMWTGLVAGAGLTLLFTLITSAFPATGALILFGNSDMAEWVVPFNVLLFGYAFALMVNALLRGFQQFRISNILLLSYTGIIPLICAFMKGHPLTTVVEWNGIASGGAALLALLALIVREFKTAKPIWAGFAQHSSALRFLASYGAPRLVTQGCTSVLSICIPWFVSHEGNERLLGGVNAVYLVLGASAILVAGMSFVLLPHLSALLAKGEKEAAGRQLSIIIEFTLFAGGASVLMALGIMEPFLHAWVGPKISGYPMLLVGGSLVIPGMLLLEILRGPMDAVSKRPWNAVTYGAGSVVAVLGLVLFRHAVSLEWLVAVIMVVSYFASTCTALYLANHFFILKVHLSQIGINCLIWAVLAACLLALRGSAGEGIMIAASLAATSVFVVASVLTRPSWLVALAPGIARRLQRGAG